MERYKLLLLIEGKMNKMLKAKITGKRQITIPIEVFEEMNLEIGDSLGFSKDEKGNIVLSKIIEEEVLCPICSRAVMNSSSRVNIGNSIYHLECWFGIDDKDKVKEILFNHEISDKDCEKILAKVDNKLGKLSNIYIDNNLYKLKSDNITKEILRILKNGSVS